MIPAWQQFYQDNLSSNDLNKQLVVAEHDLALCWLEDIAILQVSGEDASNFLQGQVSCDINKVKPGIGQFGAYCNIKGRVEALFWITKEDNNVFLLSMHQSVMQLNKDELSKYAAFSKVKLADVTEQYITLGVIKSGNLEEFYISTNNFEDTLTKRFAGYQAVSAKVWNLLKMKSLIPLITKENYAKFLPHYIGLIDLQAIDFQKGCYRGQEIIARMEYRGGEIKKYLQFKMFDSSSNLDNADIGKLVNYEGWQDDAAAGLFVVNKNST